MKNIIFTINIMAEKIIHTGVSIRGFPLTMHFTIEKGDSPNQFYVWGRVPIPDRYHSPFEQSLRSDKENVFAYIKIRVTKKVDIENPYPLYLQEFFVFSNVLKYGAQQDEMTAGFGKRLLCECITFMNEQPFMRVLVNQKQDNIYLIAGGGQCPPSPLQINWMDALTSMIPHLTSMHSILSQTWIEEGLSTDDIIETVANSAVLPFSIKEEISSIHDEYEPDNQSDFSGEEDDDEEDMQDNYELVNMITEQFSDPSLLYHFLVEQNKLHPHWGIDERVRSDWCIIKDNLHLADYYTKRYGFRIDDASDGSAIRMIGRVKNLFNSCAGRPLEGKKSRRKKTRASRKK